VAWVKRLDPVLIGILLLALALRLGYPALAGLPPRTPLHGFVIDEQEYFGAASVFADGRGLHFYDTFLWTRTPLYPLLVGLLFAGFGQDTGPVFVLQALLSVLTLAGLAALARYIPTPNPRSAARLVAALGAVWLPFTLFSNLLLSETLFLAFIVAAFLLLARWATPLSLAGRGGQGGEGRKPPHPDPAPQATTLDSEGEGRSGSLPSPQPSPLRGEGVGPPFPWVLVIAGICIGMAALTRSTALAFVPLVGLWVIVLRRRAARYALPALLALGIGLAGPLGTGVAYNYAMYHSISLGDTSSGYNLWLASTGVRDAARLEADLRAIPDPVEKGRYAMSKAWENIAAAPGAFLAKGVKESGDFWAINVGSEERQVRGYAWGRVPAGHLLALLFAEDGLYLAIVLLALAGLAAAPPHPLRALTLLWTATWMIVVFVFFAVTRFRLPVVALLLPWVPGGWAWLRAWARPGPVPHLPLRGGAAAALAALAFLAVVLPSLLADVGAMTLGVQKWADQAPYRAAAPLVKTDPAAALALLVQADQSVPDTIWAAAIAQLLQGQTPMSQHPAIALPPGSALADQYEPFLVSGAIARAQGHTEAAQTAFNARPVQVAGAAAVDWAATLLPAPTDPRLDLGSRLDFGAISGFYNVETPGSRGSVLTYRWSGPQATVRLRVTTRTRQLVLRWSGSRPAGVAQAEVQVQVQGPSGLSAGAAYRLPAGDSWQEDQIAVTPAEDGWATLTLTTNAFVPGGYDPRLLGVRIDWVDGR
jgi:hypothetical protein